MQNPAFSVVLVNYKTPEITRIALELLQQASGRIPFVVWVVDNDSGDASTEYLRSLDWIKLIERRPEPGESGFMAHGRALDMVLERAGTDYLFLLHTDTFIHDPAIFELMLDECRANEKVIAVGCVDQIYRGQFRIVWRLVTRYLKYHFRHLKTALGLKSRLPKPYMEKYVKSFCSLWNIKTLRRHGWTFAMDGKTPSYAIQDRLGEYGYRIAYLSARTMFRYLDHIEAGTVAATGGYHGAHRRTRKYLSSLEKYFDRPNPGA
jgi:GT2 family glycosyltransferase